MSDSASRRSSSLSEVERCKHCKKYPLYGYNYAHMTESDLALGILAGTVANQMPVGWHTLPLDYTSRWIHIIEEPENEDLGSDERHSDPVRG